MATCKECERWRLCEAGGATRYYGKDIAAGNVEELCSRFMLSQKKVFGGLRSKFVRERLERDAAYLKEMPPIEEETVNHPSHYQGKNECIDVMVAMFGKEAVKHFCMCNAYKYRFRADKKNGEEDIKKAEWYETKLIELGGIDEV